MSEIRFSHRLTLRGFVWSCLIPRTSIKHLELFPTAKCYLSFSSECDSCLAENSQLVPWLQTDRNMRQTLDNRFIKKYYSALICVVLYCAFIFWLQLITSRKTSYLATCDGQLSFWHFVHWIPRKLKTPGLLQRIPFPHTMKINLVTHTAFLLYWDDRHLLKANSVHTFWEAGYSCCSSFHNQTFIPAETQSARCLSDGAACDMAPSFTFITKAEHRNIRNPNICLSLPTEVTASSSLPQTPVTLGSQRHLLQTDWSRLAGSF